MERFCTNCGATLEDGALFCPECGERGEIPPQAASSEEMTENFREEVDDILPEIFSDPATTAVPEGEHPQAMSAAPPVTAIPGGHALPPSPNPGPEGPEPITVFNKPLSAATYFWTLFLFGIPAIGLLSMLIMAFAAKNANRRNLARACLVGVLIILLLLGLFMLVLVVSGKNFGVDLSKFSLEAIWEGILKGMGFVK